MSNETRSATCMGSVGAKRSIATRLAARRSPLFPALLGAALLCGAMTLPGTALCGERLRLANGKSIEGAVVLETPTRVRFRTGRGEFWVNKEDISAVESVSDTDSKPKATAPAAAKTPTGAAPPRGARPPPRDATVPASQPEPGAKDTTVADLLRDLGAPRVAVRRAAAYRLVRSWPDSSTTLAAVLEHGTDEARTEAARLLSRPDVGDTRELVKRRLHDPHAPVRKLALRAIGARGHTSLEADALRLLDEDPEANVRREAARAVARMGASKTAAHVIAVYAGETRRDQRRLYHGVLVALFGEDLGANAAEWWKAFDEVFAGTRMLVDPARRKTLDQALRGKAR